MTLILGIDPGTKCGWALLKDETEDLIGMGEWDLSTKRFEGGGMRYVKLRRKLEDFFKENSEISVVCYEEVRRHLGTNAAHIYGGIVATLTSFCEEKEIPYISIPVGTIKKRATGKGNAKKDQMIEAASEKWGRDKENITENMADAAWCADTYIHMANEMDGCV